MSRQWVFLTEGPWVWLFPAACLLVFSLCAWAELSKKGGPKAWLRISLLFLALIALLLAALRPAGKEELPPKKAILIQENASETLLDSLQLRFPEAETFALDHQTPAEYQQLPHVSYLQQYLPKGSTVFLIGTGLEKSELQYLEAYELQFIPEDFPDGLLALSYTRSLQLSDTLKITASGKAAGDSLWLRLSQAGQGIDSISLAGSPVQTFQLQALPRLSGLLEYRLDLLTHQFDTLEHYPLLVNVAENKSLRLALLSGYPSFEVRQLKNWLSSEGHSLYFQTEMAPGRYTREWLNMPDKRPTGIDQELLQNMDVLVMDQAFWNKQDQTAIAQVQKAVKDHGLGCLVLGSSGLWKPSAKNWESLPQVQINERLLEAPAWRNPIAGTPGTEGPVLAYYSATTEGWLPLINTTAEAPMVLFSQQGLGRVGLSLIESTYQLMLQDQETAYAGLWTRLLNDFVQTVSGSSAIEVEYPAFVGSKQHLKFWQEEGVMPGPVPELILTEPDGRELLLPVIQDLHVPALWHAFFWPSNAGEYQVKLQGRHGSDSIAIKAYSGHILAALQQFQDTKETHSFADNHENFASSDYFAATGRFHHKAIPLLWLYSLFLLSMAGLWIERKLSVP